MSQTSQYKNYDFYFGLQLVIARYLDRRRCLLPVSKQVFVAFQCLKVTREIRHSALAIGAEGSIPAHLTVPYIEEMRYIIGWIWLQKPSRISCRPIVGEEIDVEGALERLHTSVKASSAFVVDDIAFFHNDFVKPVCKIVYFNSPWFPHCTLSDVDDE